MGKNVIKTASPQHPFKSGSFFQSVGFACNGLKSVFRTERNFKTHVCLAVLATGAGCWFGINRLEWVAVILCMALMMSVEALNTALEYLVDMLSGHAYHEKAKLVKDIAAGACLITAAGVGFSGVLVFGPYVLAMFWPHSLK